jgi:hypothetical protein
MREATMNMHVRITSIDPIFAVTEKNRRHQAAYNDADKQGEAAVDAWIAAWGEFFATRPTSLGGLPALAPYF